MVKNWESIQLAYLCFGEAEAGSKILAFLSDDVLVAVESFLESDELVRRESRANALWFAVVKTRERGRLSRCLGAYPFNDIHAFCCMSCHILP